MKKRIIYTLSLVALFLLGATSCDVSRAPIATPEQAPFVSFNDVQMNRDALYALLRNTESPNTLNAPDIMSDLFTVTIFDPNEFSPMYNWERQAVLDNELVNNYYFTNYYSLMQANYFMMRTEEFLANDEIEKSDKEKALIQQYIGEAKVIRALAHWRVVQRFAKPWDGTTDSERTTGIIVMDKYNPLETAKDLKRSRADVYAFIYRDLDEAIEAIPATANKDVQPAIYITQDFAYAVKARVALTRQDWETAATCAELVMKKYPLTTKDEIHRLWVTEDSPEIVVRLFTSPSIGGVTSFLYAGGVIDDFDKEGNKIRIYYRRPALMINDFVEKLYTAGDVRKEYFIGNDLFGYSEQKGAKSGAILIRKYAGNPSLTKNQDLPEHKVGIHLFNVGEAYLIYAEAMAQQGDVSAAVETLKKLRDARGAETNASDFIDPISTLNFIYDERVRELIGEGFRMNDLVRRGEGMQRIPAAQQLLEQENVVKSDTKRDLKVEADDDLMIWEFPTRDRNQNKDLWDNPNWKN